MWEKLPRDDATWKDFETIKLQFPDLTLKDKSALEEGGNADHGLKVYKRTPYKI